MVEQKTPAKKSLKEIEKLVIDLAKQGLTAEKIGLKLRDEHGVPRIKVYGTKIKKILEKEDLWENPEFKSLTNKRNKLIKHAEKNIHDYKAKRSIVKNTSVLKKLKTN